MKVLIVFISALLVMQSCTADACSGIIVDNSVGCNNNGSGKLSMKQQVNGALVDTQYKCSKDSKSLCCCLKSKRRFIQNESCSGVIVDKGVGCTGANTFVYKKNVNGKLVDINNKCSVNSQSMCCCTPVKRYHRRNHRRHR
jgi:hypothetical protein